MLNVSLNSVGMDLSCLWRLTVCCNF